MIKDRPHSGEQPWPEEKQIASTAHTVNTEPMPEWIATLTEEQRQYINTTQRIALEEVEQSRQLLQENQNLLQRIAGLQEFIKSRGLEDEEETTELSRSAQTTSSIQEPGRVKPESDTQPGKSHNSTEERDGNLQTSPGRATPDHNSTQSDLEHYSRSELTEIIFRAAEYAGLSVDELLRGEKPRMISYEIFEHERARWLARERYTEQLYGNGSFNSTQKIGMDLLLKQIQYGRHHDDEGRTRINASTISKKMAMSDSTGDRLVSWCRKQLPHFLDITSHDEIGPDGEVVPRTYVKIKNEELARQPQQIIPLEVKKAGGDQYHQCQHCLGFNIKIVTKKTRTIECLDCHHKTLLDETITEQIQKYNGQQAQKQFAPGVIYHAGYRKNGTLEIIDQALAQSPSLMVVDVRYTPESKNSEWTKRAFFARWEDRYTWLQDLGNINHKDPGNIRIANPEKGIAALAELLTTHSVILLCGCPEYDTCHRKSIIELYAQKQLAFDPSCRPAVGNLTDIIKPVTPPDGTPSHNQDQLRAAAELLLSIAGDGDAHITMPPMNPSKYLKVKRKLTVEDLLDHLNGGQARGALCSYQDGRTRGLCWDVDDADGWELLQQSAHLLVSAGYEVLLEESPAGRGGHLWIIFEELVQALPARQAVLAIAPDLAMVVEYWPREAKNPLRLPGAYYARYGKQVEQEVRGWCRMISVSDNQVSENGAEAAALMLAHLNPVGLAQANSIESAAPAPEREIAPARMATPAPVQSVLSAEEWFAQRPLPEVDQTWLKNNGPVEKTTYYFAIIESVSTAWFKAHHSLDDIQPRQGNRKALSPNGQERTASAAYWQKDGEERYTDFSTHGLRADGSHDTGDVLEYASKVWVQSKAKILAATTNEMVKLAKGELEEAARAGRIPPMWVMEKTTPAGWRQYDKLRGQAQKPVERQSVEREIPRHVEEEPAVAAPVSVQPDLDPVLQNPVVALAAQLFQPTEIKVEYKPQPLTASQRLDIVEKYGRSHNWPAFEIGGQQVVAAGKEHWLHFIYMSHQREIQDQMFEIIQQREKGAVQWVK